MKEKPIPALIRRIVAQITTERKHITIETEQVGNIGTRILLRVHQSDMGKLIGKGGSTIRALTMLVEKMGEYCGELSFLEMAEPVLGKSAAPHVFEPAYNWNDEEIIKLMDDVMNALFHHAETTAHNIGLTTALEVYVSANQSQRQIEAVSDAIKVMFKVIGKANGRNIYVSITPALATEAKG